MIGIQSNYNISSAIFSGYNQMNSLRLAQAMGNKSPTRVNAVGNTGSALSSEASDFLKKYQGEMTDMMSAAGEVLKDTPAGRLAADSTDGKVADVSGNLKNKSDTYELSVESVATGQVNRSTALDSSGAMPTMGGAMHIQTGKGSFDLYMSAAGSKTNEDMLSGFADRINAAKTGVTASVVKKDGKSSLELTTDTTGGASGSFSVSGTLAERLGVDKVASQSRDAVYTVRKNGGAAERMTSADNSIQLEGMTVRLKGTGNTTIAAGKSNTGAKADAMEKLVGSFNKTLTFLNNNSDSGIGVLQQMKRMVTSPTSEKSMEKIGITARKDGTLRFDRDVFTQAMKENPTLTKSVSENFANGVRADARQGLNAPSASLVSGQAAQQTNAVNQDPIKFMSSYNRSGVYNMMNYYAVGSMMNVSI